MLQHVRILFSLTYRRVSVLCSRKECVESSVFGCINSFGVSKELAELASGTFRRLAGGSSMCTGDREALSAGSQMT